MLSFAVSLFLATEAVRASSFAQVVLDPGFRLVHKDRCLAFYSPACYRTACGPSCWFVTHSLSSLLACLVASPGSDFLEISVVNAVCTVANCVKLIDLLACDLK